MTNLVSAYQVTITKVIEITEVMSGMDWLSLTIFVFLLSLAVLLFKKEPNNFAICHRLSFQIRAGPVPKRYPT